MNRWDVVLLAVAGYVAVMALVRLMIRRRRQVLDELRRQVKMGKKKAGESQRLEPPQSQEKAA
jgi:hypothetical protein